MRFVGIDVAAERHVVAVVDESDRVLIKATPFTEDADGYAKLLGVLGAPSNGRSPPWRPGRAMRKLLHAVYSVATHRRPFVANLVTAEARP